MVYRYQHNNTLGKISSNYRNRKNPQKYRDVIFFSISHTPSMNKFNHPYSFKFHFHNL